MKDLLWELKSLRKIMDRILRVVQLGEPVVS